MSVFFIAHIFVQVLDLFLLCPFSSLSPSLYVSIFLLKFIVSVTQSITVSPSFSVLLLSLSFSLYVSPTFPLFLSLCLSHFPPLSFSLSFFSSISLSLPPPPPSLSLSLSLSLNLSSSYFLYSYFPSLLLSPLTCTIFHPVSSSVCLCNCSTYCLHRSHCLTSVQLR